MNIKYALHAKLVRAAFLAVYKVRIEVQQEALFSALVPGNGGKIIGWLEIGVQGGYHKGYVNFWEVVFRRWWGYL